MFSNFFWTFGDCPFKGQLQAIPQELIWKSWGIFVRWGKTLWMTAFCRSNQHPRTRWNPRQRDRETEGLRRHSRVLYNHDNKEGVYFVLQWMESCADFSYSWSGKNNDDCVLANNKGWKGIWIHNSCLPYHNKLKRKTWWLNWESKWLSY